MLQLVVQSGRVVEGAGAPQCRSQVASALCRAVADWLGDLASAKSFRAASFVGAGRKSCSEPKRVKNGTGSGPMLP